MALLHFFRLAFLGFLHLDKLMKDTSNNSPSVVSTYSPEMHILPFSIFPQPISSSTNHLDGKPAALCFF